MWGGQVKTRFPCQPKMRGEAQKNLSKTEESWMVCASAYSSCNGCSSPPIMQLHLLQQPQLPRDSPSCSDFELELEAAAWPSRVFGGGRWVAFHFFL